MNYKEPIVLSKSSEISAITARKGIKAKEINFNFDINKATYSCVKCDSTIFSNNINEVIQIFEEYINNLRKDIAKPFMNKAIEGLYPPGSTFKIVVALAGLESGAITPKEKIFCPGYWDYGDRRYHCWEHKGHGKMDLAGALKHSCDIYFYQIALRIGIDAIKEMAIKLGLTEKYMDDILSREMAGIMPDRYWKEKNIGARWVHGDTIISGIGQGFILTNCLRKNPISIFRRRPSYWSRP